MRAASPWAMTFLQLLKPQEYHPADSLTFCVWEGNAYRTCVYDRRISAAERWEVMAGTQRLDVGNHPPTPSHYTMPWQGAARFAGPHLLSFDKPSLTG